MRVVVMGAGLIGVASAYYLARDGHQVIVVDRQPGPARETSYATACLLTPSHTMAWARPRAIWEALTSIWSRDSAIMLRPRFSRQLAKWSWQFLRQCTEERYRANTMAKHHLARFSLAEIQRLSQEHGLAFDNVASGVLVLGRDTQRLAAARRELALLADAGVAIEVLDRDQLVALDPAYGRSRLKLAGAIRMLSDQSGDGHKFAVGLAEQCKAIGVEFRFGASVQALVAEAGRITAIQTDSGPITADLYVLALGSYSPLVGATVGLDLPVYPVKGYSVTMPILDPSLAPAMGGIEEVSHVAFSRLGERVRMTTMAEFAGYDTSFKPANFSRILDTARDLFEGGVAIEKATYWACLRPASPDGPPIVGRSRFPNLWINTGHGTFGWTMSCGSGRLLGDLVANRKPEIDPAPYRFDRY